MIVSLCWPQELAASDLRMLLRFCALWMMFLVWVEKLPCMLSMVRPRIFGV